MLGMRKSLKGVSAVVMVLGVGVATWASGCGGSGDSVFDPNAGGGGGDGDGGLGNDGDPVIVDPMSDGGGPTTCTGIQCNIHTCPTGSTTISGTIYDPAANNPLYDVVAYVPNSTPAPLTNGASCASCASLYTGDPIATALTDATGKFTIQNAPDGTNVPLVIQIGKWRKQIVIPTVKPCQDNPLPDKSLTLPKNHAEGDIPMIAISTGGSDTLECLLRRVGLDSSEYNAAGGPGHIQIFHGGGGVNGQHVIPNTSPGAPESNVGLWDTSADLMKYDIVLLSCEGHETKNMNQQALVDYAAGGGRVFASHFHYAWFNSGPFGADNIATWSAGSNNINNDNQIKASLVTTLPNGMPFPKGLALQTWLGTVGALTGGELPIVQAKHNADVSAANTPSQSWLLTNPSTNPAGATEYLSFDTPIGAAPAAVCGRVVFSDLHVGGASSDNPATAIPAGCSNAKLSPQEDALEFMLFDLSSCVTPNSVPPSAPPPVVK
ncbi:MAG: carboxypeptidase regulatory-like domain-containing protein [Polyangiaceae bacterium]